MTPEYHALSPWTLASTRVPTGSRGGGISTRDGGGAGGVEGGAGGGGAAVEVVIGRRRAEGLPTTGELGNGRHGERGWRCMRTMRISLLLRVGSN